MSRPIVLVVFLLLVLGGGWLIGGLSQPGIWYAGLVKPAFNPPAWVFAPVWTVLYVLIAIAGWRIWFRPAARAARAAWLVQMGLNFLWSPVFFVLQAPDLALLVILALLAGIAAFIALAWPRDRAAATLFLPYALWVCFAALLNASIVWLN